MPLNIKIVKKLIFFREKFSLRLLIVGFKIHLFARPNTRIILKFSTMERAKKMNCR